MVLPKGSPLLPFFNHAYNKLRQTGALYRIKQKWIDKNISVNCKSDPLEPISFYKIVSVVVLLIFGLGSAIIILAFEIIWKTTKSKFGSKEPPKIDSEKLFDVQMWQDPLHNFSDNLSI